MTFRSGHRNGKVALEYERPPKSSKQYERICAEMDQEINSTLASTSFRVANSMRSCCTLYATHAGGLSSLWRRNSSNRLTQRRSSAREPVFHIGSKTA